MQLYLGLVLVFFILAFGIKNIKTYLSTGVSIRGRSSKLTASILLSTIIYILIFLRLIFLEPSWIMEIHPVGYEIFRIIGFAFVTIGFFLGISSLISMKNSWRIGIRYEQKTALVTSGVYRISRNPYFFSYDLLILGYIFIFPSLVLVVLYVPLVIVFHKMILEEEKYLETVHGEVYLNYKRRVNRYLSLM